jgi:cardiolipin synthase (CMP-forming)
VHASTPAKKPLITANMVTVARLVPMPILAWAIYQGIGWIWVALILGTLIGCTDFVDGYLARKYGPTVLGGLLDPMADKVFVAFAYLPFADLGLVPAWAVALMFVRELLVTALRSAYEQRNLSMKTSYLGKVKTWTQMQGIGVLILFVLLANRPTAIWAIIITGIVAPLLAMGILYVVKKKLWVGALVMSALIAPLAFLHARGDLPLMLDVIMFVVVALTWVSGIDYLTGAFTQLRGRADFQARDAVRLIGALALAPLVFAVLARPGIETTAPLLAVLVLELGVGGLDNLLSHHRAAAGALLWGARILGVCALLGAALAFAPGSTAALALCYAAAAGSLAGVAWEFWRGRDYYIDARIRDKALRAETATEAP